MRVNPMWRVLRRTHRDESGAVLMVVAVTLLVLIGMLVLTVDLGRAVAVKREMVSGTDAAVIAAAHECALGHTAGEASAAASAILAENKSGAVLNGPIAAPGCGSTPTEPHLVTVQTKVQMDYFFAGIFGFNSGQVTAHAVAEWGVIKGAQGVPITVDLKQLQGCGIEPDPPSTTVIDGCQLDYPKNTLQEPRWGVLDLSVWGDRFAAPCSVPASTSTGIINNGGTFDPMPAPAYDCMDNGLSDSVWESLEGKTLLFPVLDLDRSEGSVKPNSGPLGGSDCTGADILSLRAQGYDCQIDTAYIVGWILLVVTSVDKHGSDLTITVDYQGITSGGGIPGEDTSDFGARAVRLVD